MLSSHSAYLNSITVYVEYLYITFMNLDCHHVKDAKMLLQWC